MATTIKVTDVLAHFRDAFIDDDDIIDFCTTNYSTDPNYYTGRDPRRPLSVDDCPYVMITPIGGIEGEETNTINFSVEIEWSISDRTFSDINDNGAQEMRGFFNLDQFGYLIRKAIYNLSGSNIIADEITYDLDLRTRYPHFVGFMIVNCTFTDPIGGIYSAT